MLPAPLYRQPLRPDDRQCSDQGGQRADLDQDSLTFDVEALCGSLPPGLILTPTAVYGQALVEWTPSADDIGTYDLRFVVTDSAGNSATEDARVVVRTANTSPVLDPVGNRTVNEGEALQISLSAFDADGDPLTYGVENLPPGARFDVADGIFTWTPSIVQAGNYPGIRFTASDGTAESSGTIAITVRNSNQPPVLEPLLPMTGRENAPVQFSLRAHDLDGDPIVFSALSSLPDGSTFDPRTGAFSWTPDYTQAGDCQLHLAAIDPTGAQSEIIVDLSIADVNRGPSLDVSNHIVKLGNTLEFAIHGTDPDTGTTLTYSAVGMPEGAALDPSTGIITWTPGAGQIGEYLVMATVSDGLAGATEPLRIKAALDPQPPVVTIELTPSFPVVSGQEVLIHAAADSFADITGLTVSYEGQPVTLDPYGRGRVIAQGLGKHSVTATAIDADGLVGSSTVMIKVKDGDDRQPPVVSLDAALFGARLSSAKAVAGSVYDVDLDGWRLELGRLGSEEWIVLARDDVPVESGTLYSIDPATLQNGFYNLRLTATDYDGRTSEAGTTIEINGSVKTGRFERSDTDFSTELGNHQVDFIRIYDSFNRDISGSFGYGWSSPLRDVNLQTDVQPTDSEEFGTFNPFRVGTRVFLTLPDGRRVGYTLAADQHQVAGLTYYTPKFVSDPGVDWQLGLDEIKLTRAGSRLYDLNTSRPYNPTSPEFGPAPFLLTAPDGTLYRIGAGEGVRAIEYSDGVKLAVTDSGIFAPDGQAILFVTDGAGRICRVIAPNGNQYVYLYDVGGDLTGVRGLAEETSINYGYVPSDAHLLQVMGGAGGGAVSYGADAVFHPLAADLGSALNYLTNAQESTLAAGAVDRYSLVVRPSEIASNAGEALYLSVAVEGTGSDPLTPSVPTLSGFTPLVTHVSGDSAYALFRIDQPGLHLLEVSGASAGGYRLQLAVAGDADGNCVVDGLDGQALDSALGTVAGDAGFNPLADADQDGDVDSGDRELYFLYAAKLVSYAQGFMLLRAASQRFGWNLAYGDIALLWRGGCIIRSRFLGDIKRAFARNPDLENLLLDDFFAAAIRQAEPGLRRAVALGIQLGIPLPGFSAALAFFDGYRSARLPASLLQAQRDFFGAHSYARVDAPAERRFHTDWSGDQGERTINE